MLWTYVSPADVVVTVIVSWVVVAGVLVAVVVGVC